ncbi:MAG: acetylglutamate kinase [Bacteroidales bacterium]|nr:acetylglutamate kinase [Bacteroidales bacterium]MBR1571093.1 acetylglutamate kinase [Bacteroidales bacterium]
MIRVVKIGGNVIDDEEALKRFCHNFASLEGPRVLVHGGGALASRMQEKLGMAPVKIQGRRVTDPETLQIVTMVYAGWCNKQIVSLLQADGCQALGLSGCDANAICASRRPPLDIDGEKVDFGAVGDVTPASVNRPFLESLLQQGIVPVLSPINHDGAGNLLNTNADTVAASVAAALRGELWTCFEKDGVLADVDRPESLLPLVTSTGYESLKAEGIIAGGMIPKLENAFRSLREGAVKALILNADAIATGRGTQVQL